MTKSSMNACGFLALAAFGVVALAAPRQEPAALEAVLDRAVGYVSEYEKAFAAIVSEERYGQRVMGSGSTETRQLRSDVILVHTGPPGWLMFRDVYEVNGTLVRDRDDRVLNLLLKPNPDAHEQAKRIADESARYNIGPIKRTINTPTLALAFLRRATVGRSAFRILGGDAVAGVRAVVLRFQEQELPRIVETRDQAAARGRFWIDPASGRVLKTELSLESAGMTALIVVTYADQPTLDLWVPIQMVERYRIQADSMVADNLRDLRSGGGLATGTVNIEGTATYGSFRRFSVDVSTFIRR